MQSMIITYPMTGKPVKSREYQTFREVTRGLILQFCPWAYFTKYVSEKRYQDKQCQKLNRVFTFTVATTYICFRICGKKVITFTGSYYMCGKKVKAFTGPCYVYNSSHIQGCDNRCLYVTQLPDSVKNLDR